MVALKTQSPAKEVKVIARAQFKANGYVVYRVLSSNGRDVYDTTLKNGKALGCSCPATKPCYHMTQLEAREQARASEVLAALAAPQREPVVCVVCGTGRTYHADGVCGRCRC